MARRQVLMVDISMLCTRLPFRMISALTAVLVLVGCEGLEELPFVYTGATEIQPRPGPFSGPAGQFFLVRARQVRGASQDVPTKLSTGSGQYDQTGERRPVRAEAPGTERTMATSE